MADIQIQRIKSPNTQSLAYATADQRTILGAGTPDFPLRAEDLFGDRVGVFSPPLPFDPKVGMFVVSAGDRSYAPAVASAGGDARAIGVIVEADVLTFAISVRSEGIIAMPPSDWDTLTGGSGGLTPGLAYFVSDTIVGGITEAPSMASGTSIAPVGVAFSSTVLILSLPSVVTVNP